MLRIHAYTTKHFASLISRSEANPRKLRKLCTSKIWPYTVRPTSQNSGHVQSSCALTSGGESACVDDLSSVVRAVLDQGHLLHHTEGSSVCV